MRKGEGGDEKDKGARKEGGIRTGKKERRKKKRKKGWSTVYSTFILWLASTTPPHLFFLSKPLIKEGK